MAGAAGSGPRGTRAAWNRQKEAAGGHVFGLGGRRSGPPLIPGDPGSFFLSRYLGFLLYKMEFGPARVQAPSSHDSAFSLLLAHQALPSKRRQKSELFTVAIRCLPPSLHLLSLSSGRALNTPGLQVPGFSSSRSRLAQGPPPLRGPP